METGNKTIQTQALVDEALAQIPASEQHLSIQLGLDGLSFCIKARGKYLLLKNYDFFRIFNWKVLADTAENIFRLENLHQQKFQVVELALAHQKFSLVPLPLYDPSKHKEYLEVNASVEASEKFGSDMVKGLDARNIFTIPHPLEKMLERNFPEFRLGHYLSPLISTFLNISKNLAGPQLLANIHRGSFDLALASQNKLKFCNTFNYQTEEDVAYFLLFACEQLKLNPEETNLLLAGAIDKEGKLFNLLEKHIRHIQFLERQPNFSYSYKFEEIPAHYYYFLLNR